MNPSDPFRGWEDAAERTAYDHAVRGARASTYAKFRRLGFSHAEIATLFGGNAELLHKEVFGVWPREVTHEKGTNE